MVCLRMHGGHCHEAAVCEQWLPELALDQKKRNRVVLLIEKIIDMLGKCGLDMVNCTNSEFVI